MSKFFLIFIISSLAILIRTPLLNYISVDMWNFGFPWYNFIAKKGGIRALGYDFYDYNPLYIYFLVLVYYCLGFFSKLVAIKSISIAFDFIAAFFAFKIVGLKYKRWQPIAAFASILFAPTVVINGAYWGQADMLYTSMLLGFIYFVMIKNYFWSVVFYALAFSFKQQALFLSPVILFLFLREKLSFRHLLVFAGLYFLLLTPCWIMGRPFGDVAGVYFKQFGIYRELSKNAPNIYFLINNKHYDLILPIGFLLTLILGSFLAFGSAKRFVFVGNKIFLEISVIALVMAPSVLPKMHDRYFFPAEVISIVLAFYNPKLLFVPVLLSLASLRAYGDFLHWKIDVPFIYAIYCTVSVLLILFLRLVLRVFRYSGLKFKSTQSA